jgi:3-deoxy-D-arabino-heptulosonate 7-phosphate (DAHP) synthase class II
MAEVALQSDQPVLRVGRLRCQHAQKRESAEQNQQLCRVGATHGA